MKIYLNETSVLFLSLTLFLFVILSKKLVIEENMKLQPSEWNGE